MDPKPHAYPAPEAYGSKPAHSSHIDAPKPKHEPEHEKPKHEKLEHEKPKHENPKTTPTKQKQTTEECISKRSALGLDFSACTKGGFQGSLGGSKMPVAPKASPASVPASAPVVDAEAADISEPKAPTEPKEPKEPTVVTDPFVPTQLLNLTKVSELTKVLSPVDTLPLNDLANIGDVANGRKDDEDVGTSFELPIGKSLKQLLPSGESDPSNPDSDPVSFATSAAQQLQKSGVIPKRQVRPALTANGAANGELSGNASADEESASFGLDGGFTTSATASESLAERSALRLSGDEAGEDDSSLTSFLIDGDSDSVLAPLGLTGSLTGAVSGSASASRESMKRSASILDDAAQAASFTGNAQGELSGSTTGRSTDESASFNAKTAAKAAANAQSDLSDSAVGAASGSFDLAGSLNSQFEGSAIKRSAQLSLDAVTALLAPLTGAPAAPGAPAKRELELPVADSADFLSDFKTQLEGQLTTSTSAAADVDAADEEDTEEMIKRNAQLSLDAVTALLAPLTGAPAAKPGAPAKRAAQLSLDAVTALLAPLTGAPAAPGAAPAKRQLGLDSITALLAPITGSPAPKAGAAPAKRQLGLDAVTGLLAPITGAPAPGAPAKRDVSLANLVTIPSPNTPLQSPYSEHSEDYVPEEKVKSIPQPANIHFGEGALDEKLEIQCIKTASGKCKSTKPDEDELIPSEDEDEEAFNPTAPQYHGSLDFVEKLLPKLKASEDNKEVKPTQEKSDILGTLTNVVPVPI